MSRLRRSTVPMAVAMVVVFAACKGTEAPVATPTSISLSPGSVSLNALGATHQVNATVLDERGVLIAGAAVLWSSDNSTIAAVSASGLVTAAAVGTTKVRATITLQKGNLTDSVTVTVAQVPARLVKVAGDLQTDTVAVTLPTPLTVRVIDSLAHPIPGVVVNFTVTAGGGQVSSAAGTTDATGGTSVRWTIGSTPGANAARATTLVTITGSPADFSATGVLGGSSNTVAKFNGDGQTGLTGAPVNFPPSVQVRDAGGAPLVGGQVTFAVTDGSGSITGGSTTTDLNGIAAVGSWTITAGSNALTATVSGTGIIGNPVTFTATGIVASFHIDVRFLTTMTTAEAAAFTSAANKWQSLIIGDVPDIPLTLQPGLCTAKQPGMNEIVDDIVIFAEIDSIDGPGKILGRAAPCLLRAPGYLPVVGVMQFDSADVANLIAAGRFDEVVLHEMGHVLGFGTIWQQLGLLVGPASSGGTDPHFVGAQAVAAFDKSGGQNYSAGAKVPVENCVGYSASQCGAGTYDSHWRETVFQTELMSGFLNVNVPNPLSVITTASMGDLGYTVNYAGADPYTVPLAPALRAPLGGETIELGNDILRLPMIVIDAGGRVIRVIRPR